jgi:hypothetical protein
MTLRTNTFEGGSNTTVITIANSGGASGDAFDDVTGATLTFSSAQAYNGSLSMLAVSGVASSVRWQSMSSMTLRGTSAAGTREFVQVRTSGGTNIASLALNSSNQVVAVNVGSMISGSESGALSVNNWYRIDFIFTVATTSTGRIQYRVMDVEAEDNDTPESSYDSTASLNLGTTALGRMYFGNVADATIEGNWWFDSIRVDDTGTTFLNGLYVPINITETLTDDVALLEATDGTPPFTISQDSGASTTPTELDDGAVSGTGMWLVAKHPTDTLVYTVTDDVAVESAPYSVPPIRRIGPLIRVSGSYL